MAKRRSVAQQMAAIFSQWREALDSDDPVAAVEEFIAAYQRLYPDVIDPTLAREAAREKLSERRSRERVTAPRRRP
jgi:hypothetical protein